MSRKISVALTLLLGGLALAPAAYAGEPDSVSPETFVDSGPAGRTTDDKPVFTFSASESKATFECRLDSDPFAPCSGPGQSHAPATSLALGAHSFEVRAIDPSLNSDATPARRDFTVISPLAFELTHAVVSPGLSYFDGTVRPSLRYRFKAARPVSIRVEVVQMRTGRTVQRWRTQKLSPREFRVIRWDGTGQGQEPAPDGRYAFKIAAARRELQRVGMTELHGHAFPIRGPHRKRGPIGEFGASRGGRAHTGFDINSPCGTSVVAARGGRVREAGYEPNLFGNFVVINARKEDRDYVYLHLEKKPEVVSGEQVLTAQRIGQIGKTGNAVSTPCHLHFAIWRGRYRPENISRDNAWPIDPEPMLDLWNGWS